MNQFMVRVRENMLSVLAICAMVLCPASLCAADDALSNWETFKAKNGGCSMKFPATPKHHSDKVSDGEQECELSYDAYVAAMGPHTVFMLLVASYPESVDESYAQLSLEAFLNGILTHNPSNQLVSADMLLVNGHEALDFCIRSGSIYFKGRAIMVKNSLYLMAMESEMQTYDEAHYKNFVESFSMSSEQLAVGQE